MLCGICVKLHDGDLGTRVFVIKTRLLGELIACNGYGHITGGLMPAGGLLRTGEEFKEFCDPFVGILWFVGKYPQRSATNNGVLRCTINALVVGQGGSAKIKLPRSEEVGPVATGAGKHAAFARSEQGIGCIAPAAIGEENGRAHV